MALLFVLWAHNSQTAINASDVRTETSNIETIIVNQLKNLLTEINIDDYSQMLIKKHSLKGNFTKDTRKQIRTICQELDIEEDWLYKIFKIESKGNPKAINKLSGASGLIQIMPTTAKNLNTTVEEIRKMSIEEQLPFVKKYISNIKGKRHFNEFLDLYLAVFYPRAIDEPHDFVLGAEVSAKRAAIVAKQNKGIDSQGNGDGLLTKGEISNWVS